MRSPDIALKGVAVLADGRLDDERPPSEPGAQRHYDSNRTRRPGS